MRRYATSKNKDQQRADWMCQFSDHVVRLDSKHAGRIDWDTANHLYNIGKNHIEAALQYVANRAL